MKNVRFKITGIIIFIGSILISVNNLLNLKNFNGDGFNKVQFVCVWIASIFLFSVCSMIIVDYILKIITKPFSNIVDNAGLFN